MFIIEQSLDGNELDRDFLEAMIDCFAFPEVDMRLVDMLLYMGF